MRDLHKAIFKEIKKELGGSSKVFTLILQKMVNSKLPSHLINHNIYFYVLCEGLIQIESTEAADNIAEALCKRNLIDDKWATSIGQQIKDLSKEVGADNESTKKVIDVIFTKFLTKIIQAPFTFDNTMKKMSEFYKRQTRVILQACLRKMETQTNLNDLGLPVLQELEKNQILETVKQLQAFFDSLNTLMLPQTVLKMATNITEKIIAEHGNESDEAKISYFCEHYVIQSYTRRVLEFKDKLLPPLYRSSKIKVFTNNVDNTEEISKFLYAAEQENKTDEQALRESLSALLKSDAFKTMEKKGIFSESQKHLANFKDLVNHSKIIEEFFKLCKSPSFVDFLQKVSKYLNTSEAENAFLIFIYDSVSLIQMRNKKEGFSIWYNGVLAKYLDAIFKIATFAAGQSIKDQTTALSSGFTKKMWDLFPDVDKDLMGKLIAFGSSESFQRSVRRIALQLSPSLLSGNQHAALSKGEEKKKTKLTSEKKKNKLYEIAHRQVEKYATPEDKLFQLLLLDFDEIEDKQVKKSEALNTIVSDLNAEGLLPISSKQGEKLLLLVLERKYKKIIKMLKDYIVARKIKFTEEQVDNLLKEIPKVTDSEHRTYLYTNVIQAIRRNNKSLESDQESDSPKDRNSQESKQEKAKTPPNDLNIIQTNSPRLGN